jgi:hypothetical protein
MTQLLLEGIEEKKVLARSACWAHLHAGGASRLSAGLKPARQALHIRHYAGLVFHLSDGYLPTPEDRIEGGENWSTSTSPWRLAIGGTRAGLSTLLDSLSVNIAETLMGTCGPAEGKN